MFNEDSQLVKSIIKLIESGKMEKEDVKPFYNLKEAVENGIKNKALLVHIENDKGGDSHDVYTTNSIS